MHGAKDCSHGVDAEPPRHPIDQRIEEVSVEFCSQGDEHYMTFGRVLRVKHLDKDQDVIGEGLER